MTKEADLEKKLTRWAKDNGILTYKFVSPAKRGVPDRIFIRNGKVVFLELKAPGEHPTPLQMRELGVLLNAGATAAWVDDLQDAKTFLLTKFNA
jgi:hypothetical protein